MAYCTQAECLYLPIWEKLPFALGGKGLSKETQNLFLDSFGFKNPILDFLEEMHPMTP